MLHVSQRAHTLRPSYGIVFLQTGVLQKRVPLFSAHDLQLLQVPGQLHRRHRIRLRTAILGIRPWLSRDANPFLRCAVIAFELVPLDRPVVAEAVQRFQPDVFLREPLHDAAEVDAQSANRLGPRDDSGRLLILNDVAGIRVLAVVERPLPRAPACVLIEESPPGFDHDDRECRASARTTPAP